MAGHAAVAARNDRTTRAFMTGLRLSVGAHRRLGIPLQTPVYAGSFHGGSGRWPQHHPYAHLDVVADNRRVRPLALADAVVVPVERERALDDAIARRIRLHRDRHRVVAGHPFERELADHVVAIAAEIADGRRREAGDRELAGVEPAHAPRLLFRLGARE